MVEISTRISILPPLLEQSWICFFKNKIHLNFQYFYLFFLIAEILIPHDRDCFQVLLLRCVKVEWSQEQLGRDFILPGPSWCKHGSQQWWPAPPFTHYSNIIMSAMASQITSFTIVYTTIYSGADQRKYQSSASLAFVRGIHRWPVNSPHKGPIARKMFPFDDVIMSTGWYVNIGSGNGLVLSGPKRYS